MIGDVAPWQDWAAAASGALDFLHENVGWDVWMVTRVTGGRQVVLCASPGTPVRPGAQLPWEESFCRAMTEGRAPRVATVTAAVPEYAALTKGLGRNVAAYLGVPLVAPDGTLFGTVCGVAFRAKPAASRVLSIRATSSTTGRSRVALSGLARKATPQTVPNSVPSGATSGTPR